jgi:hypothetical protein
MTTEILAIIDRSGSMSAVLKDAIGGFNTFLAQQKSLPDEARFTLVEFNHAYNVKYNGVPIEEVSPYDLGSYVPTGTTALLDATAKGISEVYSRIRNGKVLVAILTDGEENASHEVTKEQLKRLIKSRQEDGWEFIYLVAGVDQFTAEHRGAAMGISSTNTLAFSGSGQSYTSAYSSMNNAATSYRTSGSVNANWRDRNDRNDNDQH